MKTATAIQGMWGQSHSAEEDTEASSGQGKAVATVSVSSSLALLSTHAVVLKKNQSSLLKFKYMSDYLYAL